MIRMNDYKKSTVQFVECVEEYVEILKNYKKKSVIEFLLLTQKCLSKLYWLGASLPVIDDTETINSEGKNGANFYHTQKDQLGQFLKGYNNYHQIFNPTKLDEKESTKYSISGDLSEIFDDLVSHLDDWHSMEIEKNKEAIWQWQFGWEQHWGWHVLSALRAMHQYIEEYFVENLDQEIKLRNTN